MKTHPEIIQVVPVSARYLELEIDAKGRILQLSGDTSDGPLFAQLKQLRFFRELRDFLAGEGFLDVHPEFGSLAKMQRGWNGIRRSFTSVLAGPTGDVLVASVAFDRIRRRFLLTLSYFECAVPDNPQGREFRGQCLSAIAVALQLGPLRLRGVKAPITNPLPSTQIGLIALRDGTSASLNAFLDLAVGDAIIDELEFQLGRWASLENIIGMGFLKRDSCCMEVRHRSHGSGLLRLEKSNVLVAQTEFFWGSLSLNHNESVHRFIRDQWPSISQKEAEVLTLLASGLTIKETAGQLGKSLITASIQARSGLQKTTFLSTEALLCHIQLMTVQAGS